MLRVGDDQLPTFDAESKSAKIQNSLYSWGGGGVGDDQLSTFHTVSESAKIKKFLYGGVCVCGAWWWGGGGGW